MRNLKTGVSGLVVVSKPMREGLDKNRKTHVKGGKVYFHFNPNCVAKKTAAFSGKMMKIVPQQNCESAAVHLQLLKI